MQIDWIHFTPWPSLAGWLLLGLAAAFLLLTSGRKVPDAQLMGRSHHLLGLYGAADTGISVASVERMKSALAQAGAQGNAAAKACQFVMYPDTPHAFHADYRPSYAPGPAVDGWNRAIAWMKRYL